MSLHVGSKSNKPSLWDVPPVGAVLVPQPVLLEARPVGGRVGVVVRAELEVEEALVIGHHVDVDIDHLFGLRFWVLWFDSSVFHFDDIAPVLARSNFVI